jgi:hypothetical protein
MCLPVLHPVSSWGGSPVANGLHTQNSKLSCLRPKGAGPLVNASDDDNDVISNLSEWTGFDLGESASDAESM